MQLRTFIVAIKRRKILFKLFTGVQSIYGEILEVTSNAAQI